jgi:hypothetical protein
MKKLVVVSILSCFLLTVSDGRALTTQPDGGVTSSKTKKAICKHLNRQLKENNKLWESIPCYDPLDDHSHFPDINPTLQYPELDWCKDLVQTINALEKAIKNAHCE